METSSSSASSRRQTQRRIYLRGIIFCVIAAVVLLGLLLLLLFGGDAVAGATPFLITVQVGLLSIVIYVLVQVVRQARSTNDARRNALANRLAARSCPDYWTLNNDNKCINKYDGPSATFRLPANTGTPGTEEDGVYTKLNLTSLDNKSLQEVCDVVDKLGAPWTDLKPTCNAHRADM